MTNKKLTTKYILIIDDQFETRRDGYVGFFERLGKVLDFEFDVTFLEDPALLLKVLSQQNYSFVICDVVLREKWNPQFDLPYFLEKLSSRHPVVLISDKWNQAEYTKIETYLTNGTCIGFLHWRDLEGGATGERGYAIAQLSSVLSKVDDHDFSVEIGQSDSISIVHFSDLQFGGFPNKDVRQELVEVSSAIMDYLVEKKCKKSPTFIVLSGDIAERGLAREYDLALNWINLLLVQLSINELPSGQVYIVAGNHDICLPLRVSPRIDFRINRENREFYLKPKSKFLDEDDFDFGWMPYLEFAKKVSNVTINDSSQSMWWVDHSVRHLGVVFYGINTAQPSSPWTFTAREVSSEALSKISESIKSMRGNDPEKFPLAIGIGHHAPVSLDGAKAVSNYERFEPLFGMLGGSIFMHGHVHKQIVKYSTGSGPAPYQLVRSQAATLTKPEDARAADTARGFTVLLLHRTDGVVSSIETTSFGFDQGGLIPRSKANFARSKSGKIVPSFE